MTRQLRLRNAWLCKFIYSISIQQKNLCKGKLKIFSRQLNLRWKFHNYHHVFIWVLPTVFPLPEIGFGPRGPRKCIENHTINRAPWSACMRKKVIYIFVFLRVLQWSLREEKRTTFISLSVWVIGQPTYYIAISE